MDEILVHNFMVFDEVVRRRRLRPGGRRRGLGRRPLPAREPRAQAVRVRLDDGLRRLAADARRRPARGGADRRLQRRDDRAARPVRRACATARCSSATPTTWSTDDFGPGLPSIRDVDARRTSTSPGTSPGSTPRSWSGTERLRARARRAARTSSSAWSPSAGPASATPLLRRVMDVVPLVRQLAPELRFAFVTGPRIDPASLPACDGVDGARVRARPVPAPRRLRRRRGPGRADHDAWS